jgi:hypothetical protein
VTAGAWIRSVQTELTRLEIHHAERAKRIARISDKWHTAVKAAVRLANDHRAAIKTRVLRHVWHHEHFSAANRRRANCSFARRLTNIRRQTIFRLEPSAVVIDEADISHWAATNLRREFSDFVVGDFRWRIENVEHAQSKQPFGSLIGTGNDNATPSVFGIHRDACWPIFSNNQQYAHILCTAIAGQVTYDTVIAFPTDGTLRCCSGQPKDMPAAALSAGLPSQ